MTCNNPKIDLAKMNAYIKSRAITLEQIWENVNPYIKFGEKLSITSQDIERKQSFDVNQGP